MTAIAFAVLHPIGNRGMLVTDDGDWFVIRLSAFYQTFRDGQFPVRFLGRLNYNYGYPVANFLYPGYMYIGSIIHLLGVPFTTTVELLTVSSVILTSWFLYLWLSAIFPTIPAVIGSIVYLVSPYLAYDIFRRGSIGEVMAGMFAALTLAAIERKWRAVTTIALVFLILSHNTIGLLLFGIIFLYILLRGKDLRTIFVSMGLSLGMSSFFWLPALYEQRFTVFSHTVIADPETYLGKSTSISIASLGIVITSLLVFFVKTEDRAKHRMLRMMAIAGVLAVVFTLPISAFFWNGNILSLVVQFPYRLLSILWITGPFVVAAVISSLSFIPMLGAGAIIIISSIPYVFGIVTTSHSIYHEEGYYSTNESTTTTHDEYMPTWVIQKPMSHSYDRVVFVKGAGILKPNHIDTEHIDIDVTTVEDSILQVNTIFYPGWGGMIDGVPMRITFDNPMGLMQVLVPKGSHHMVMAFRETPFRFVTLLISLFTGIAWFIIDFIDGGIVGRLIYGKRQSSKSPVHQ